VQYQRSWSSKAGDGKGQGERGGKENKRGVGSSFKVVSAAEEDSTEFRN